MNGKALIAIIALASIASGLFFMNRCKTQTINLKDDLGFAKWRQTFNKVYSTPKEHQFRQLNFLKNLENILSVNADKALTYKAGLNAFSDLTEEEFVAKYTGLAKMTQSEDAVMHVNKRVKDAEVDWRQRGAVNPVKNQGQCGSCWAFSAIGAVESAWQLAGNQLTSFSEQQLVDCAGKEGNHGCNGGLMNNAFTYFTKDSKGVETEADYPYTAKDGTCKFDKAKIKGTIRAFSIIAQQDCDGLLHAITQQPVSIGIAANAIMSYTSGVFNNPRCGTQLNHGVVAIGYGTDGSQEYWIVRNSWGASWGEQGYIRMARDDNKKEAGMCGICLAASYPTV